VRIGIHPDDPPQPMLAGVPRCIFSNFEGYKRAIEIANSPNIGVCLCCGSWLEGGKKLTGADPVEMRSMTLRLTSNFSIFETGGRSIV
jgi:mannonate dehydratase